MRRSGAGLSPEEESVCLFHYFLLYQRLQIHWKRFMACGLGAFVLDYHIS